MGLEERPQKVPEVQSFEVSAVAGGQSPAAFQKFMFNQGTWKLQEDLVLETLPMIPFGSLPAWREIVYPGGNSFPSRPECSPPAM